MSLKSLYEDLRDDLGGLEPHIISTLTRKCVTHTNYFQTKILPTLKGLCSVVLQQWKKSAQAHVALRCKRCN